MLRTLTIAIASFIAGVVSVWACGGFGAAADPALVTPTLHTDEGAEAASRFAPLDSTPAFEGSFHAIEERLAQLAERIDGLAAAPRSLVEPSAAGSEELAALTAIVLQLQETLQQHVEDSRADLQRADELQKAMNERPESDWVELNAILETYRVDEERARMEVQLLTFARIVGRFGKPNLTWSTNDEIVWVYGRDYLPESDSYRTQVMFHFKEGLVTRFYVEP